MNINILQSSDKFNKVADATIIIDVIKAFMKKDIKFFISNINNSRFVMKVSNHNKLLITKKIIF